MRVYMQLQLYKSSIENNNYVLWGNSSTKRVISHE